MSYGFLIRLDALLEQGLIEQDRAQLMERYHRSPEEWELERVKPMSLAQWEGFLLARLQANINARIFSRGPLPYTNSGLAVIEATVRNELIRIAELTNSPAYTCEVNAVGRDSVEVTLYHPMIR